MGAIAVATTAKAYVRATPREGVVDMAARPVTMEERWVTMEEGWRGWSGWWRRWGG